MQLTHAGILNALTFMHLPRVYTSLHPMPAPHAYLSCIHKEVGPFIGLQL